MKTFIENIPTLPNSTVGVLLRHAERESIVSGTFGNEVRLTPYGIQSCVKLNNLLKDFSIDIQSSPIIRCVETAALLSNTISLNKINTSTLLGNPGIFVVDPFYAQDYFLEYSLLHIARHLLSSAPNPTGFCLSTAAAINYLMRYMLNTMELIVPVNKQATLKLFVTHDSILVVVLGYFFPNIPLEDLWPDYLEGLIFWKNEKQLTLNYRQKQRKIPW